MGNQRFSITPAKAAADNQLSDSIYRTLAVIGIYGDRNGWCWPRQQTVADIRGVSRQTVNHHIRQLVAAGYLNITPRYDEETGAQKSSAIQIRFDFDYDTPPNIHDLTGGVKPKTLQGVSSPELDRGCKPQDLTHNDPTNGPKKDLNNVYTHPDPEPIHRIKTALSGISKTPFWVKTEEEYDSAAYTLFGWDATPEMIAGFAGWWQLHGYYAGKPSLKSVLAEWSSYHQPAAPARAAAPKKDYMPQMLDTGEIIMVEVKG